MTDIPRRGPRLYTGGADDESIAGYADDESDDVTAPAITRELLQRLPKTDLHVHLDGSLRPSTMIEIAREYGVLLPAQNAHALGDYMHVTDARNLVDYLARFDVTLSIMQRADAIERIAYELAEDAAIDGVRYMEVRFCPALNTREGLTNPDVVEAALRGLRRAELDHRIQTGLIVCALRNQSPAISAELARLAAGFHDRGVIAFDLAGAENGNPPSVHLEAFDIAANANVPITIHAGEAFGALSIHEAIHTCRARRIGHGTTLAEDPELLSYVNDFRIPLELCLTSNVQTHAAPSMAEHPARMYYDHGLMISFNTDNRLMSATTMTDEFWAAHIELGFDWDELCDVALMGFEAAFLPFQDKVAVLDEISAEILELSEAAG